MINQNLDNSTKLSNGLSFCAGPSLPGLATVSALLFEKEEYSLSTSHYSSRRENTSTLRVTLQAGRPLLYESLCHTYGRSLRVGPRSWHLQGGPQYLARIPLHPYYSSRRKNTSTLRVMLPRPLICCEAHRPRHH